MDGPWRRNSRSSPVASRGPLVALVAVLVFGNVGLVTASSRNTPRLGFETRTLDGSNNNPAHPRWGQAGTNYRRIAAAVYADGVSAMVAGPNSRYVSNRIFNDVGQNLFSENDVSQWGWAWGQFIDHDIGLRDETPAEHAPIAFNALDPLEAFTNDFGALDFARTPAAPNTGTVLPRQQVNTITSYIDASNVYGSAATRLDWLRDGPVDGNPANNSALLLLPDDYLPTVGARAGTTAPPVDLMGRLMGTPDRARVAGDVRANENIALTAIHTMFAREHNRIVASLPASLPEEVKFQIARRVVGAEVQYITYHEFLPALGVRLPLYRGYDPRVNATLSNEFAVVGYRAHSMIHGQFDVAYTEGAYSPEQLQAFQNQGIGLGDEGGASALNIPLSVAFGNPDLLPEVGLGAVLQSLSAEREYRNDEQIDNTLRSVLFQVPKPGTTDPAACQVPVVDPNCFSGVADLGALDVERGRDHGMPSYNDLRRAYGLDAKRSFTAITGETTDQFPADPLIDSANAINDPNIVDFVELRDADGNVLDPASPNTQEEAVSGVRRTTLAARLRAVYGSVNKVDAFVGMVSEPHVRGSEFGALQLAIWRTQFAALRDGDRFFFANDPGLALIARAYGVSFRHTLAELVQMNSDAQVPADVFKVPEAPAAPVAAPALVAPAVPNAAPSTAITSPDSIPTTSTQPESTTVGPPPESAPVTTPSTTTEPVTVPSTTVPESTTSPPVPATTVPASTTSTSGPPTSAPAPP